MVNKCCVVGCTSSYNGGEVMPVFSFPKDDDLRKLWVRFVNRNCWTVTKSSMICLKHFDESLVHKGASEKRFRLLYNLKPVPTMYPASIATASLQAMFTPRKSK
ncbi:THAP domain-containing protein 2-like [Hydra vulgaris]|uniref:THAP domain-containing protein 2-like n=1 Tax=Hydra vulgaris TaxID=6087 RepID=A0ABM4CRM8_HYDVU